MLLTHAIQALNWSSGTTRYSRVAKRPSSRSTLFHSPDV
jgi:hypothetical protein